MSKEKDKKKKKLTPLDPRYRKIEPDDTAPKYRKSKKKSS